MTASAKPTGQEVVKKGFLSRLSRRNKIIGVAVLVFLMLLVVSIPGDRNELIAREARVEAAQIAYELAFPAIEPSLSSVMTFLDSVDVDLSANRSYTRLAGALTTFNRANSSLASRFPGVVTFSSNVHSLLDGENAVPELDTDEFRTVVADMDTALSVAWIALMELNDSIDSYNGYHGWISATVAGALFSLPQGYVDPLPANTRLTRESLTQ
ncbi:MAG: hypothetical protein HZC41_23710 [Chloroflexi bacterium]|nr:hypothetical protein [Chloroflexota bacterium]